MLVKKYHDTHCEDKEVLISIKKAIDASPDLRSKKALIENFIAGINDMDDIMAEWHEFVAQQREQELVSIIQSEGLKETETRKFMDNCFRDGEVKTIGTAPIFSRTETSKDIIYKLVPNKEFLKVAEDSAFDVKK